MSRKITQPINQVRLTNVAVVRMNRKGKRFEIACYRNKVVNYRQGLETDLDEVLQTDRIFTNVSKGQFAKAQDLQDVFGTRDQEKVAVLILEKGTLQVSDLERSQQLENTLREVATWVANNCVDPNSQRPYTVSQIRDAMKQAEFCTHPTRSVKRQYLDCVRLLQQKGTLPIERAKMQLLLVVSIDSKEEVQARLEKLEGLSSQETSQVDDEFQVTVLVDPSLYRAFDEIGKDLHGRLEILKQVIRQEGDVNLETEVQRKADSEALRLASAQLENLDLNEKTVEGIYRETNANEPSQDPRQAQKKAQKKSKKAKRREKEEAAERQARLEAEKQRQEERGTSVQAVQEQATTTSEVKSCNTCGGSFASANAYRSHFRSDWHRYNVKLKLKGVAPVSEEEFAQCDSDAFFEQL